MEEFARDKRYTYADWLTWPEDERWELIDGTPYLPAQPSVEHQSILGELFGQLHMFLKGKPCRVFLAPFGVRLNPCGGDDTILEPDLAILCGQSELDKHGCKGAPDMVAEILSPSTAARDKFHKFNCYLKAGVREYWIVDPDSRTVSAHVLTGGQYVVNVYGDGGQAPVSILSGCVIDLRDLFQYNTSEEQ